MGQAKHRARRARVQQAGAAAELSADARTTGPSGRAQAGGRGTHRLLTDCPAAEEGAAAALLPPVVGDPIAVWLILKSKRHSFSKRGGLVLSSQGKARQVCARIRQRAASTFDLN